MSKAILCLCCVASSLITSAVVCYFVQVNKQKKSKILPLNSVEQPLDSGFPALVGNTPLIELKSLSNATGRIILAKAEFLNPGGSSKDRIAKGILDAAENAGHLARHSGYTVIEGTSGSTGVSLALMAKARGYHCIVVMPNDQAKEKTILLEKFGAEVVLVPPSSIVNPKHYVNEAKRLAKEIKRSYFVNQFENEANYLTHYMHTGKEIWDQTNGKLHAFVMSAGTGGTIAGISKYLKKKNKSIKIVLGDPPGSSLHNKIKHNVCYSSEQAESTIRRHRYDTITEGIGLDRLTYNFLAATIDDSIKISDMESICMSRFLLEQEGLFVGASSGLNCAAAVKVANDLPSGSVVVTVLCDSGIRHLSKFWNNEVLQDEWNIPKIPRTVQSLSFLKTKG